MNAIQPSAHIEATVDKIQTSEVSRLEQAEAFVEVALDLQKQPKEMQDLLDALFLYQKAEEMTEEHPLARARAIAGRGTALRRMPGSGLEELTLACEAFEEALPIMREQGTEEETAEVEMNYGLVLQALASAGKAPITKAVETYHRALRFFTRKLFPREFAILHNNLATAYLSMRLSPEREVMREALAVQSFQEALKVINLEEDPTEYAMLQNNLGNALQAMRSKHPWEDLHRAVEAYNEALKVRTPHDTPIEYANTLTNKANALMNLPDDMEQPQLGNPQHLTEAAKMLREAETIFTQHHVHDRAHIVGSLAGELEQELTAHSTAEGSP